MPCGENVMISYPNKVYKFTYNGSYLFYAISNQKLISVNEYGADILNLAKDYPRIEDIIQKCAEKYHLSEDEVKPPIITFIKKMLKVGFLEDENGDLDVEARTAPVFKKGVTFKELYLHLTNECNQKCLYCYNKTFRTSLDHKFELSLSDFEHIVSEFSELGGESITFTGGEPLLSPYLLKLAKFAKKRGLRTNLLTNGTLCNTENAADICKNIDQIIVSLDSKHLEEHEFLRGKNTYTKTVAGIKTLSRYLRENNLLKTKLFCRPVITLNNINNILDYPQFMMQELGCSRMLPAAYVPNDLSGFNGGLFLSFQEILTCLLKLHSNLETLGGLLVNDFTTLKFHSNCSACTSIISIAPDGSIYPCQSLHHPDFVLGNIKDGSLDQVVMASPISKLFQEFHYSQIPTCTECVLGPICGGGCRAIAYRYYHNFNAYNEVYCPFYRQRLEFGLWLKTVKIVWDQDRYALSQEEGSDSGKETRESGSCP